MKKVYLAGPDVFEKNSIELGKKYVQYAQSIGLVGLYPLDNKIDFNQPNSDVEIYQLNKSLLESADYVVANLNDFRGAEPDSGTVWEIAYAIGIGKKVIGYVNNSKTMLERISETEKVTLKDNVHYDKDEKVIENFGNSLNLMLQHSITQLVVGDITKALDAVKELSLKDERKIKSRM